MNYHDLSLSLAQALIRSQAAQHPLPAAGQAPSQPQFTITVSREAGARGNSVATEVGRRLGWPVFDRNILETIGEELHRPPFHLEGVDERPASWLGECLSSLFDKYQVSSNTYLKHLFAAVRGLGETGRCVIVGRGANFLLAAETTLRVRLISSLEERARVVALRLGLSAREADAWVKTIEHERVEFVKRTFKEDPTDPHHYDLVLNLSRLSVDEASDVIIETLHRLERRVALAEPKPASPALV